MLQHPEGRLILVPSRSSADVDDDRAVYTVREVAHLLSLSLCVTYALVRSGEIPARRLGGRWVIPRARFQHGWTRAQLSQTPRRPRHIRLCRPWPRVLAGTRDGGFVRKSPAGNYRACWRDPADRQRSKTFRTKREANAFLAEVEAALNRGLYVAPDAGRPRVSEYAGRWLVGRNDEQATAARDVSIMRNHVLPARGRLPLDSIEHSVIQAWVTELGGRLSPATVRECYRLLNGVMRSATRDRLIGFNPCEGFGFPAAAGTPMIRR